MSGRPCARGPYEWSEGAGRKSPTPPLGEPDEPVPHPRRGHRARDSQALVRGLEDLLPDPRADGAHPTVEDCYDVQAIADEVLELFVFEGGFVYRCPRPDTYPGLFWRIAEKHARPADS